MWDQILCHASIQRNPIFRRRHLRADPVLVDAAAQAILAAESPLSSPEMGVRISGAYDQLIELAELIAAPVATTASGKGVFPENHPLALGVFGSFGQRVANRTVSGADLIFVIGSKLAPSDTAGQNPPVS